jgi:hypothetical protein
VQHIFISPEFSAFPRMGHKSHKPSSLTQNVKFVWSESLQLEKKSEGFERLTQILGWGWKILSLLAVWGRLAGEREVSRRRQKGTNNKGTLDVEKVGR